VNQGFPTQDEIVQRVYDHLPVLMRSDKTSPLTL